MALDRALFERVQQGAPPVLRLYRWQPACLSFGRNQKTLGIYDPARIRAAGVDVVRRPTGGLAVLHDGELTYALIAPAAPLGGPRAAYLAINEALVAGLRALGVPAEVSAGPEAHAPSPDALHPCFARPAPGEVVARARKLVGSAQRVECHTILQHGSILRTGTQESVLQLQHGGRAGAAPRGEVTLEELLGTAPDWGALAGSIRSAFEARFGIALAPAPLSADERNHCDALSARFAADEWTWRR